MTIFSAIEVGRSALRAQQKGMEVSGQNIANANTPGYSRQRADMESVMPAVTTNVEFSPGRGVEVEDITRIKSEFYHEQQMNTGSQRAYWETRQETLSGAEVIFKEPGGHGLSEYMSEFFDTWNELSSHPESMAVRMSLRENTETFTRAVQDSYGRLEDLNADLQEEMQTKVDQLNSTFDELAEINSQLQFIYNQGEKSNELLDKRDTTLEEISELIDISVHEKEGGVVDVFAAGRMAVQEDRPIHMELDETDEGKLQLLTPKGHEVSPSSGELRGLEESVNEILPGLQEEIDNMVEVLVEEVNALHREGYGLEGDGGLPFFKEIEEEGEGEEALELSPAQRFEINPDLAEEPALIAASTEPDEPGNGENALEIGRVRDQKLMNEETTTLVDYYRGVVSSLGVEGQESQRMKEALEDTETELQRQNDAVSSVDIDEEMMDMMQFQHAWSAASRFLSYVDGMIETLFVELGR